MSFSVYIQTGLVLLPFLAGKWTVLTSDWHLVNGDTLG